jgi:hypothetical protein
VRSILADAGEKRRSGVRFARRGDGGRDYLKKRTQFVLTSFAHWSYYRKLLSQRKRLAAP